MNPRIITPIVRSSLRSTRCRYLHASQVIPEAESSLQARQRAQAAEAKAKAWYIEEEDDHVVPSSRSSGPVFTTYNPTTTLPEPAQDIPLQPIPSDLPEYAKPLHMFLTNNELFVPHSISFNRTQGSKASKSFTDFSDMQMERGKRRRGKTDSGDGIVIPGHEVGAFWNWIVVAQVAARGKGAVGRGERSIREYLHFNPLNAPARPNLNPSKKLKVPGPVNPDSEWSLLDAGQSVCINIMTAEGREKWGLEDAWKSDSR